MDLVNGTLPPNFVVPECLEEYIREGHDIKLLTDKKVVELCNTSLSHNNTLMEGNDGQDVHDMFQFVTEGVLLTIVSTFGFIGNTMSVIVLTRRATGLSGGLSSGASFSNLLRGLAAFDALFLLAAILSFGLNNISSWYTNNVFLGGLCIMRVLFGLIHTFRIGSVYMTLAVTFERFHAIIFPLRHFVWKKFLIPTSVAIAVLYNIPKYFELEITVENNRHMIKNTALRSSPMYVSLYVVWSKVIFIEIIPYFAIVIMNIFIITKITKSIRFRRKFQRQYPDQETTTGVTYAEGTATSAGRRPDRSPSQGDGAIKRSEVRLESSTNRRHNSIDDDGPLSSRYKELQERRHERIIPYRTPEEEPLVQEREANMAMELTPHDGKNEQRNIKIIAEPQNMTGQKMTTAGDKGDTAQSNEALQQDVSVISKEVAETSVVVALDLSSNTVSTNALKESLKDEPLGNEIKVSLTPESKYKNIKSLGFTKDLRRTSQPESNAKGFLNRNKNATTKKGTQVHKRTFLRKQQEEHSLGIILILMSILFVICQALKIVPDMYEIIVCRSAETYENTLHSCEFPDIITQLTNISHLLLCVNSSANFVIYYCAGGKFRQAWLDTYGCWWCCCSRSGLKGIYRNATRPCRRRRNNSATSSHMDIDHDSSQEAMMPTQTTTATIRLSPMQRNTRNECVSANNVIGKNISKVNTTTTTKTSLEYNNSSSTKVPTSSIV